MIVSANAEVRLPEIHCAEVSITTETAHLGGTEQGRLTRRDPAALLPLFEAFRTCVCLP
jgi:hypothetical protein